MKPLQGLAAVMDAPAALMQRMLRLTGNASSLMSIRQTIVSALAGEHKAWLFVLKAMLSLYLALYLSLALELPSPSSTMLTVLVVMNSQSGMVMAKAFYRILGTLMGVTMAVIIVALFPQQPVLMLSAMAIWTAICSAGAMSQRGLRSYTFVLSGYTVAMIVLPVVNHPLSIFDVAVHRLFEVLLGLAVTTLVFDGLFPQQLAPQVRRMADDNRLYLLQAVTALFRGQPQAITTLHMAGSTRASGFDDLLSNAVFEGPWVSSVSRPLRRSNHHFMQTLTRLQALQRFIERQPPARQAASEALRQLMSPLATVLEQAKPETLADMLQRLMEQTSQQRLTLAAPLQEEDRAAFSTAAALVYRVLRSLLYFARSLQLAEPGQQEPSLPRTRFSRMYDPAVVMVSAVRTCLITFIVGSLWISSGWTSGATGMFIVVTLTMMLAPLPNPLAAIRMAAAGHTLAPFLALLCFSILPSLTTFPMLIAGTAPFLLLMLYPVTRPGLAGFAIPLNIGFTVALSISHYASTDYANFFNELVATLLGVALVTTGFLLIPGVNGTPAQQRRYLRQLDHSLTLAATGPLPALAEHLESRNRDIANQMVAQLPPGSERAQAFIAQSLRTQEACYVILSLREDLASDLPGAEAHGHLNSTLNELVRTLADEWHDGALSARGHRLINLLLADAFAALNESGHSGDDGCNSSLCDHLYLLTDVLDEQLPPDRSLPAEEQAHAG